MQFERQRSQQQVLQPRPDADPLLLDRNDGVVWRNTGQNGDQTGARQRSIPRRLQCRSIDRWIGFQRSRRKNLGQGSPLTGRDMNEVQGAQTTMIGRCGCSGRQDRKFRGRQVWS